MRNYHYTFGDHLEAHSNPLISALVHSGYELRGADMTKTDSSKLTTCKGFQWVFKEGFCVFTLSNSEPRKRPLISIILFHINYVYQCRGYAKQIFPRILNEFERLYWEQTKTMPQFLINLSAAKHESETSIFKTQFTGWEENWPFELVPFFKFLCFDFRADSSDTLTRLEMIPFNRIIGPNGHRDTETGPYDILKPRNWPLERQSEGLSGGIRRLFSEV